MPKYLTTPFASEATSEYRTDVQNSTGAEPNSATYEQGFPPVTMEKIANGGKPPKGSDLNGVLYDITDNIVSLTKGARYGFNEAYATAIGGYPLGAVLRLDNGVEVESEVDANSINPNIDMTGWKLAVSDNGIVTWSGRTQREENNNFITTVLSFTDLNDLFANNGRTVFVKQNSNIGTFVYDANDTTTASDGGGTVYVDSKDRRWKRRYNTAYLNSYTDSSVAIQKNYRLNVKTGSYALATTTVIPVGYRRTVNGETYNAVLSNYSLNANNNNGQIKNLTMGIDSTSLFNISIETPEGVGQPYFTELESINVVKGNGVYIGGIESYLHKVSLKGGSNLTQDTRANRGLYLAPETTANSKGFDISYNRILVSDYKIGVELSGAIIGHDAHIYACNTGMKINGDNSLTSKPGQKTFFGVYFDKNAETSLECYGTTGTTLYSPHVYEAGLNNINGSEVNGIRLRENSFGNAFYSPTFSVNSTLLANVTSLIRLGGLAKNNLIVGATGSYKLDEASRLYMRNQTVIGCEGEWARHNNISRKCRGMTSITSANSTAQVVINLDYTFPSLSNNIVLFSGKWVSRSVNNTSAFGDIDIIYQSGLTGSVSTVSKKGGDSNILWGVDSVTLVGSVLTINFRNTGTLGSKISFEIERTIDADELTI